MKGPKKVSDEDVLDRSLVESAEREAKAQLAIIQALGKLRTSDDRRRVIEAVGLILEAESRVPGVLEAIAKYRAVGKG